MTRRLVFGMSAEGGRETAGVGVLPFGLLRNLHDHQHVHTQRWRFLLNLAAMLCDIAMFLVSGATVFLIADGITSLFTTSVFSPVGYLLFGGLAWAFVLRCCGIYHRHVMGDFPNIVSVSLRGALLDFLVLAAVNYVFDVFLPVGVVVSMVLLGLVMTLLARGVVFLCVKSDVRKGAYAYPTVLVGSLSGIGRTLRLLGNRHQLNYRPIAVCPIREDAADGRIVPVEISAEDLAGLVDAAGGAGLTVMRYDDSLAESVVRAGGQTVMVVDVLHRDSDNFHVFSLRMESLGLEIALLTSAADTAGHQLSMRSIAGMNVVTISLPQYGFVRQFTKRVFDIVVSLIAIIVSSPLMIGVAIAIKLDDGGPVLYKQERIGLRGKPFKIYKFRSMGVGADKKDAAVAAAAGQSLGARFKVKNDPRVTRIGHFIRKTSLDELPQFFNSLLGTMSVVGPRPQRQYEVDEYNPVYATRLLVKPGITGPWQVSGRNDLSEEESQQLDVFYVQNWSVLGDIVYILRTVLVVLHPKGAY